MTVRLTSDGELSRLEALRDLDQRWLTSEAAAQRATISLPTKPGGAPPSASR